MLRNNINNFICTTYTVYVVQMKLLILLRDMVCTFINKSSSTTNKFILEWKQTTEWGQQSRMSICMYHMYHGMQLHLQGSDFSEENALKLTDGHLGYQKFSQGRNPRTHVKGEGKGRERVEEGKGRVGNGEGKGGGRERVRVGGEGD
jgi:hypothetical protein